MRPAPRSGARAARAGRAAFAALAALVLLVAALAGCSSAGGDQGGSTSSSGSSTASPVSVDITFKGTTVTPRGERVKVPVGQDVTLHVTADQAGEIHVHTSPEQELAYAAGTTKLLVRYLDTPGIVEVESHALDTVILQLQVQ